VFVHTDRRCEPGERLVVRLSFPKLLEPFELEATVASTTAGGVGDPQGVTLEFSYRSEREAEQLLALLARVDQKTEPVPKVASGGATKVANGGSAPVPKEASRPPFCVLLVDDSRMIREAFTAAMSRYFTSPFVVDTAEDCEQGWALLRTGSYDLTIIDFFLPLIDGSKLVEQVRRESVTADLPIVAISVGGSQARDAFLAAGADLYLDKPIVMRDLLRTLGQLTRG